MLSGIYKILLVMYLLKKNYHHGDLKNDLLTKGIAMLNVVGLEGFSFNKLAKECSVTPPAIYAHFKSKEDLLIAIREKVLIEFQNFLYQTPRNSDGSYLPVEFGINYIKFFMENPQYFDFLSQFNVNPVNIDNINDLQNRFPFLMFKDSMKKYYIYQNMSEDKITQSIFSKWAMVVGLSYTIVKKRALFSGNWLELCRSILLENLKN